MTDYAELRAALDAATPGPWKWVTETCERGPVWKGKPIRVSLSAPRNGDPQARTAVLAPNWNTSEGDVWQAWISCNEANAAYIAACHPEAIRALLAERDALLDQHHRDSKELRRLCAQRDAARKVSKEAGAVIAGLKAEMDALREALETMVEMVEMNGFGRAYAMDVARAALAQEQEEGA